ncbi:DinB family protein [Nocardioides bizhenqiangii]|uniref:DinB family protein n=1 Tax=Nocardioides bizhenqiangii TaxID=3095076 RepID=A0ABZ0ZW52_9ACTN|nr:MULTISPECIES: DinB family protein [unclassified Nocardioides]MDZ5622359.1 DinB family protein [Nocardioides sp. HM23]WQQ28473.1 DinB family protein [Nocardioides sp. HM61]
MEMKDVLVSYLTEQRMSLLQKLDGLSERELRTPRTSTGTNLIGIVKHCMNVEYGYFGPTFGRTIDDPAGLVPEDAYDTDPQVDWYATAEETCAGIVDNYQRVQAFCDETIDLLSLDAQGRVPWWGDHGSVTLGRILVHVIVDLARHAGHADILREQVDGAVGCTAPGDNLPEIDFPAYVARLTELADRF